MGWHDWQKLDPPPGGRAALIAAASWAAGHLDLVATTSWPPPGERRTRAIWHRTLDNAGSSKKGWGTWQPVVSETDMSALSERDATIVGVSLATWGSRRLDLMLPDYRHFWFNGQWHVNAPPSLPVTPSENGAGEHLHCVAGPWHAGLASRRNVGAESRALERVRDPWLVGPRVGLGWHAAVLRSVC